MKNKNRSLSQRTMMRLFVFQPSAVIACCFLSFCIVGCGPSETDLLAQRLKKKKRLQEAQEMSRPKTLDERLMMVEDYLNNENVGAADKEISKLLESHPEDAQVLFVAAEFQALVGNELAAVNILERVKPDEKKTTIREALWLAVGWLVDAYQFDAAEEKLNKLLELPGKQTRVHRKLAMIFNNQGRRFEAREHMISLAEGDSISERELVGMIAYCDPYFDVTMEEPEFASLVPAMLCKARLKHAAEENEEAVSLIEALSRKFPESTPIAAFRGRVYTYIGDDEKLKEWFKSLPDGMEVEPEYWHVVGMWLQKQEKHRQAVRAFAEAVRRDETDRYSYRGLAKSLNALGERVAAERVTERFDHLVEINEIVGKLVDEPGSYGELSRLSKILLDLKRPAEAMSWKRIALEASNAELEHWTTMREESARYLSDPGSRSDEDFRSCDLDLTQWPLPKLDELTK